MLIYRWMIQYNTVLTTAGAQLAMENKQRSSYVLQVALNVIKLVLNVQKAKRLLFHRAGDNTDSLHITPLYGSNTECVSEYKHLCVWLDDKLTFKCRIETHTVKQLQKISFLYGNRSSFPIFCPKRIIEAVCLSVLDYGDVVCL